MRNIVKLNNRCGPKFTVTGAINNGFDLEFDRDHIIYLRMSDILLSDI